MKIYFGNYVTIYFGTVSNRAFISHQACCIAISRDKKIQIHTTENQLFTGNIFLIPSMLKHKLICEDVSVLFILIEPNLQISRHHKTLINSLDSNYKQIQEMLQTIAGVEAGEIEFEKIDALFDTKTDTDARINKAIAYIKKDVSTHLTTHDIAKTVFLSESRLQHLFKENVGIPIRKYIHWQRLMTASKNIMSGQNFTTAAFESGFSDSPHFNRTFSKMFGMTPSDIFKQ